MMATDNSTRRPYVPLQITIDGNLPFAELVRRISRAGFCLFTNDRGDFWLVNSPPKAARKGVRHG